MDLGDKTRSDIVTGVGSLPLVQGVASGNRSRKWIRNDSPALLNLKSESFAVSLYLSKIIMLYTFKCTSLQCT